MKRAMRTFALAVILASGTSFPLVVAEEEGKRLPTLLIKGEVVSVDTLETDEPNATLMKIRDRYGFETPIFVTTQTQVFQGEDEVPQGSLQTGEDVAVEYNFDINTAKRYAVKVQRPAAEPSAPASKLVPAAEVQAAAAEETSQAPAEAGVTEETKPAEGAPVQ